MDSFDLEHWHAWDEVIAVNEVRSVGAIVTSVSNWTNTVQEDGRNPIDLQAWFSAYMLPDGNGGRSITRNTSPRI